MAAALACTAVLLIACGRTEQGELGQRIDMGPYTFEVVDAKQGRAQVGFRMVASTEVLFRLHRDDTAQNTPTFDRSFENKMHLVDTAGNTFDVYAVPNTEEFWRSTTSAPSAAAGYWRTTREVFRAGRRSSDTYRASIALDPLYNNRGQERGPHERFGESISDFRLIIDNPRREGDQPGRVVIQLQ